MTSHVADNDTGIDTGVLGEDAFDKGVYLKESMDMTEINLPNI